MQNIENLCRVVQNERINDQTAILTLDAPTIAANARPGQFVNLSCDQFLRRPIGIMDADLTSGQIRLGIRVKADGTRWLAERQSGDTLSVLGPLGHGYELSGLQRVITVGGGTGVFPLYFVQRYCQDKGIEAIAVCGYRSQADSFLADRYSALSCQTLFASDAGDMDVEGHAAQALEHLLKDLPTKPGTAIFTCGPKLMMQTVAAIADRQHMPCQVSLEERMACGVGVCLVCVCAVNAAQQGQPFTHQRCCVEGPVFPAEVVEWSI